MHALNWFSFVAAPMQTSRGETDLVNIHVTSNGTQNTVINSSRLISSIHNLPNKLTATVAPSPPEMATSSILVKKTNVNHACRWLIDWLIDWLILFVSRLPQLLWICSCCPIRELGLPFWDEFSGIEMSFMSMSHWKTSTRLCTALSRGGQCRLMWGPSRMAGWGE
jgi:hypothetical protein